jgi:hypothetical protein
MVRAYEYVVRLGEMAAEPIPVASPPVEPRSRLPGVVRRFITRNWKVVLYVLLIVLCVIFAPDQPLKFIYTEF